VQHLFPIKIGTFDMTSILSDRMWTFFGKTFDVLAASGPEALLNVTNRYSENVPLEVKFLISTNDNKLTPNDDPLLLDANLASKVEADHRNLDEAVSGCIASRAMKNGVTQH
jgi:hypothetical protein